MAALPHDLAALLAKWQAWARTADRSEDGWQGYFPDWSLLIASAENLMTCSVLPDEEFLLVEMCWQISEEDEDLADYAKANLDACWENLVRLAKSSSPNVRWQVYEVLSEAGSRGGSMLRSALYDEDSYCRRRALLSLGKINPQDIKEAASRLANDLDPHVRRVALELVKG